MTVITILRLRSGTVAATFDQYVYTESSNKSLEPTVGRCYVTFDFMKQFVVFATLTVASGGSAPSR